MSPHLRETGTFSVSHTGQDLRMKPYTSDTVRKPMKTTLPRLRCARAHQSNRTGLTSGLLAAHAIDSAFWFLGDLCTEPRIPGLWRDLKRTRRDKLSPEVCANPCGLLLRRPTPPGPRPLARSSRRQWFAISTDDPRGGRTGRVT